MFDHPYASEKLLELERRRVRRFSPQELPPLARRGNGFARSVGRAMRRAGEQLEAWAGPSGSQSRADYLSEARRY